MEISKNDIEYMKNIIAETGYDITDEQIKQFIGFYEKLIDKNKVMNLTAITEYKDVVEKHFADSLLVSKAMIQIDKKRKNSPELENARVLDMGTGAGFPGIPLKICEPGAEMVLVDSLRKRIEFLDEVIKETGLYGIETIHSRGEDLGRDKKYRKTFDIVVSRAVAALPVLAEYCIPLLKSNGYFIAYKSGNVEEEVSDAAGAVKKLGGARPVIIKETLPGTDIVRSFVFIKKERETPAAYPRKAGVPGKNPLK